MTTFVDKYGKFTPHLLNKIDQILFAFVVVQESARSADNNNCANVNHPIEALRKRQFIIYIFMNLGKGSVRNDHAELACKGEHDGHGKKLRNQLMHNACYYFRKKNRRKSYDEISEEIRISCTIFKTEFMGNILL